MNSSIIKFGEITTCSALFAVKWTMADPIITQWQIR